MCVCVCVLVLRVFRVWVFMFVCMRLRAYVICYLRICSSDCCVSGCAHSSQVCKNLQACAGICAFWEHFTSFESMWEQLNAFEAFRRICTHLGESGCDPAWTPPPRPTSPNTISNMRTRVVRYFHTPSWGGRRIQIYKCMFKYNEINKYIYIYIYPSWKASPHRAGQRLR